MPDESSASSEHALIQEITAPLATLPDDALPMVSEVDFPIVLRGYDRDAVDAYVERTRRLVSELQATRSPEAAVRRALERVGEEVSGILQRAHETAAQITASSRTEAENRLENAHREAAQTTAEAERRLKELDGETDRIWDERQRIVEDARDLARQLLGLAESASERFPADEGTGAAATGAAPRPAAGGPSEDAGEDTAAFPAPFGAGAEPAPGSGAGAGDQESAGAGGQWFDQEPDAGEWEEPPPGRGEWEEPPPGRGEWEEPPQGHGEWEEEPPGRGEWGQPPPAGQP